MAQLLNTKWHSASEAWLYQHISRKNVSIPRRVWMGKDLKSRARQNEHTGSTLSIPALPRRGSFMTKLLPGPKDPAELDERVS